MPMIRLRCGGWHHTAGTIAEPWRPFRRPSDVQNLPNTWTYRSVLIVTDRSLSSSNQNGPMMPCLEMATQAVHFTECNGLCRQCSGGVLPQKMLFEFTWPDNRKCASSENQTLSRMSGTAVWMDFCRKYATTINIFCSVVNGVSKVNFGRLLEH